LYFADVERAKMSGGPRPEPPASLSRDAVDFLRTVDAGDSAMPASNAMRKTALSQIFSYWARFGCPSLFLTFTPDDMRSMILRKNAGLDTLDPNLRAFLNDRRCRRTLSQLPAGGISA